jgi:hypothetical protein
MRPSLGEKRTLAGYESDVPWTVMTSSFREAERLRREEPDRFDAIVSEGVVAEPDLASRDPLSLVTLDLYDQRVNT